MSLHCENLSSTSLNSSFLVDQVFLRNAPVFLRRVHFFLRNEQIYKKISTINNLFLPQKKIKAFHKRQELPPTFVIHGCLDLLLRYI